MKISIITATLNSMATLKELVGSLRTQTDKRFEWIISDGGSTDGTIEYLNLIDDLDVKIVSQEDFGIYDAFNKALRQSAGEYYLIVGSDDILYDNAIADFNDAIVSTSAPVITANIKMSERVRTVRDGPSWLYGASSFITGHSVGTVFKISLHDKYGMYSSKFPIAADSYFVKTICQNGERIYYLSSVVGEFGDEGVSTRDVVGVLSEFYRVQLLTEKNKFLQTIIYILRLLKNVRRL